MAGVSRVLRKKLERKDGFLGVNQQFRQPSPRLLRDEPGGSILTGMPASHELGGCLSCHPPHSAAGSVGVWQPPRSSMKPSCPSDVGVRDRHAFFLTLKKS